LIGLQGILLIDIVTFVFAVSTLLMIDVPPIKRSAEGTEGKGNLLTESLYGLRYIVQRRSMFGLQMVFFFGNLLFSMAFVLLAPMILARTGDNEAILATVMSAIGVGGVIGGVLMSVWGGFKKKKIHGVLLGWTLAGLLGTTTLGLGQGVIIWGIGAFCSMFFTPLIDASNQAIWQSKVPPDVQGRVFAARRLIAQISGPVGMLFAGFLADYVFEPAMQVNGVLTPIFGRLVGVGTGAGMALIFVITGLLSILVGIFGYALPFIRNAEDIVPDYDEQESLVPA
jgi:MFS family permease